MPVGQEGEKFGPVGKQVGVNGDCQRRTTGFRGLNRPNDVGLRAIFLTDEQSVAFARIPFERHGHRCGR